MIKGPNASSFLMERDDFSRTPLKAKRGLGKRHPLFGNQMDSIK